MKFAKTVTAEDGVYSIFIHYIISFDFPKFVIFLLIMMMMNIKHET
jgi:hypothetical protein